MNWFGSSYFAFIYGNATLDNEILIFLFKILPFSPEISIVGKGFLGASWMIGCWFWTGSIFEGDSDLFSSSIYSFYLYAAIYSWKFIFLGGLALIFSIGTTSSKSSSKSLPNWSEGSKFFLIFGGFLLPELEYYFDKLLIKLYWALTSAPLISFSPPKAA
jgi:hypothetical protein